MPLLVAFSVVLGAFLAPAPSWNAGDSSLIFKGFKEPVSVVALVGEERLGWRQGIQQGQRPLRVAQTGRATGRMSAAAPACHRPCAASSSACLWFFRWPVAESPF